MRLYEGCDDEKYKRKFEIYDYNDKERSKIIGFI